MTASTVCGQFMIRADPQAPLTFYFEEHVLRLALVRRESIKLLSPSEWGSPGVYFLIEDPESRGEHTRVYVGKSRQKDGVRGRLLTQNTSPSAGADFTWTRVAAFTRPAEHGLNSAQVGYLEGRLSAKLRKLPTIDVQAGKRDEDETLHPAQSTTMDALIPTFVVGLRLAGLWIEPLEPSDTTQDTIEKTVAGKKKSYSVSIAALLNVGTLTPGDVLVFERKGESRTCTVAADGVLLLDGEEFTSPSSAAVAAYPGDLKAAAGWDVWKLRDGGKSLGELRDEFIELGKGEMQPRST